MITLLKGMSNVFETPQMQRFNHRTQCESQVKKVRSPLLIVVQSMIFINCYAPRGVQYSESLGKVEETPDLSVQLCGLIVHQEDRSDCMVWGVHQQLKAQQILQARGLCSTLIGSPANECALMLAVVSAPPIDCTKSGSFAHDCRLHLLNQTIRSHSNADLVAPVRSVEPNPADREPWTVIHRFVLEEPPLNLGKCDQLPQSKDCLEGGQGLFHDYLRRIRDQGLLNCQPSKWLERFQYVPHPILDPNLSSYLEVLPCSG